MNLQLSPSINPNQMDRSEITGIVLAGGKSSRMGREKGFRLSKAIFKIRIFRITKKPC